MSKPIKFRHGRRVVTFNHETRHNVEIYRFEDDGQRVQLELRDGVWRASLWAKMAEGLFNYSGRLIGSKGRPCERKNPRSLAKVAAARWCSTHE